MGETLIEPVYTQCPDRCGAIGAEVYLSEAHPLRCDWMLSRARRCREHDELLRPDEPACPFPGHPRRHRRRPPPDMTTRRLSVEEVFRAALDSLTASLVAKDYDVEEGLRRFRAWLVDQGYVVPDDGPVSSGDGEEFEQQCERCGEPFEAAEENSLCPECEAS